MKLILIALIAALVSGCAINPKALSGASAGANAVLGFYSTTADLRQQLAQDTIKESAQLEYLSYNKSTCRDNPGYMFGNNFYSARNIKAKTIEEFEKSDSDYIFLTKYSIAFDGIIKSAEGAATDITNYVSIIKSAGKYSSETAALSEVVSLLGTAAIAINEEVKFRKLRDAATKYQPQLELLAKRLSGRLGGLDRETIKDISVWRNCVQEKFDVIWALSNPSRFPTSVTELDAAYGAFQAQYRSYVGTSPQIGEMLSDLVKANKAISMAPDSTRARESIERYILIFDSSRSAITRAGALPS
ncbi:MAG: hypothetical protein V4661_02900 [Pseudomonadota bacterium]